MISHSNSSTFNRPKHMLIKKEQVCSDYDKYKRKYKHIRKTIKELVFENAALCDHVAILQEKILIMKEERNYLIKKLQLHQGISEGDLSAGSVNSGNVDTLSGLLIKKSSSKRRASELSESIKHSTKLSKKLPVVKRKKVLQTIPLDVTGRPKFPIKLGDLTVHSLGEVVADRPDYHSEDLIYPVGFCSTRVYGSLTDPEKQCVYTCTVLDGGPCPRFDIVADSDLKVIRSYSLDDCHSQLLREINRCVGTDLVTTKGKGADFFGLSHPTIHHLIQSSPGVRKCHGYVWTKFDVSRANEGLSTPEIDATISYEALQRTVMFSRTQIIKQEPEESYGENNMSTFQNLLLE